MRTITLYNSARYLKNKGLDMFFCLNSKKNKKIIEMHENSKKRYCEIWENLR